MNVREPSLTTIGETANTDVTGLLIDYLDLWTGAVTQKRSSGRGGNGKVELTGIKKLRELILELAVRGKLVAQDPDDEPASVLLERIAEEKARLVREGKIKKPKRLPEITEEEKPFELPEGWQWTRLSDVLRVINGRAYKKHEMLQEGTPLLRVGNLFTSNEWYYSDLDLEDDKYIDHGDLIYAWSASFGPFIWDGGRVIYHYHIWKLELYDHSSTSKNFLYNYLKAVTQEIKSSGSGIAMIHMTKAKMEELVIPFPPLEEQLRIVEKVDELMALCDRLEQQVGDQLEAHEVLVDTLLDALTLSADAAELAENWARIAEHFDTLCTTEASIDKLKQTILQLAIMGRLVPQDSDDEPASVLLEKIAEEKARQVKEGKIKKSKKLPAISENEIPYQLPKNWEWVHFQNTGHTRLGKMLDKSKNKGTAKDYLRNTNVQWWRFDLSEIKQLRLEDHEMSEYSVEAGDLLICEGGEPGRCAVWEDIGKELYIQKAIHRHRTLGGVNPHYLKICLTVASSNGHLSKLFTGATIKHLPGDKLARYVCPLPPVTEQHRITDKVDELMALCDRLKAHLGQADESRAQLATAVVEQTLS